MRLGRRARERAKAGHELEFWLRQQRREGGPLENRHYEYFFTEYFGLDREFYAGKGVLDVGCGPRGSLETLTVAQRRVGLDPLADEYRRRLGAGRHAMEYVASPAERMPFEDASFDVVSSFNSLDHVEEVAAAAREMCRVLAAGGTLLLATDINHPPTPTEPQTFGPEIIEHFVPPLEVGELRHLKRHPGGVFASLHAREPHDEAVAPGAPAVLVARLEKPGLT